MSVWPTIPLIDTAIERGLVGGPFGSSLVGSDYVDVGVPVIRGANLNGGSELSGKYVFVSGDKFANELSRNSAKPGDLVFTQRGTLGQIAIVPKDPHEEYVVSQSQMRLRVDPSVALGTYVYYACTATSFLSQLHDNAIATGVPHINLAILARLEIPLPSIGEQRGIAEVLSALDDKIAANTALAATVADLTDAVFAVAVRGVPFSAQIFGDLALVAGGGTPSTKEEDYWNGDVNWATPTDVTALNAPYLETTSRRITQAGLDACASELHPAGSILMTSRATIGAFAVAQTPTAVNQGFIVVRGKEPWMQWWLFHEMRSRVDEFLSHANGATFLELSRGNFKRLPVRLGDELRMKQFSAEVASLHERARAAMVESDALAQLRDTLLPQLMSGKVRVKDAEQLVGDVV